MTADLAACHALAESGAEIAGMSFTETAWPESDWEAARFHDCTFEDVVFNEARLAGAEFTGCRLRRCRFTHAALREAVFTDCQMTEPGPEPVGTRFAFSELRDARLVRCDLSFAVFDRSAAYGIELDQCNLIGARFHQMDFSHSFGRKHVSTQATLRRCNLTLADFADASLPGCDLSGSRLREADLGGADLTDADLSGCDLFQAALSAAKLAGADLRGAEVSGLVLTSLASYAGLKVDAAQAALLLEALGLEVRG